MTFIAQQLFMFLIHSMRSSQVLECNNISSKNDLVYYNFSSTTNMLTISFAVNFNNLLGSLVNPIAISSGLDQDPAILRLSVTAKSGGGGYPQLFVGGAPVSLGTFEKDEWQHITISIDNDSQLAEYNVYRQFNGSQYYTVMNNSSTIDFSGTSFTLTNKQFVMCAAKKTINSGSVTLDQIQNGLISNVHIIDTQLTPSQVMNLALKNQEQDANISSKYLAYFRLKESAASSSIQNMATSSNISLTINVSDMYLNYQVVQPAACNASQGLEGANTPPSCTACTAANCECGFTNECLICDAGQRLSNVTCLTTCPTGQVEFDFLGKVCNNDRYLYTNNTVVSIPYTSSSTSLSEWTIQFWWYWVSPNTSTTRKAGILKILQDTEDQVEIYNLNSKTYVIVTDSSGNASAATVLNVTFSSSWVGFSMMYDGYQFTLTIESGGVFTSVYITAGILYPLTTSNTTFNFSYTTSSTTTNALSANIKDLKVFNRLIMMANSSKMQRNVFSTSTPGLVSFFKFSQTQANGGDYETITDTNVSFANQIYKTEPDVLVSCATDEQYDTSTQSCSTCSGNGLTANNCAYCGGINGANDGSKCVQCAAGYLLNIDDLGSQNCVTEAVCNANIKTTPTIDKYNQCMLVSSIETTQINDFTLPFYGFTQNNNDSNAMIIEFWALNDSTQNAASSTSMLTITTKSDQALTNNTDPVRGKIVFSQDNSVTLYKLGQSDADITFAASSITYQSWQHQLLKIDISAMTVAFYINGGIKESELPIQTLPNYQSTSNWNLQPGQTFSTSTPFLGLVRSIRQWKQDYLDKIELYARNKWVYDPTQYTGLVFDYPLDQGIGQKVKENVSGLVVSDQQDIMKKTTQSRQGTQGSQTAYNSMQASTLYSQRCGDGEYQSNGSCTACSDSCDVCVGSDTNCIKCASGQVFDPVTVTCQSACSSLYQQIDNTYLVCNFLNTFQYVLNGKTMVSSRVGLTLNSIVSSLYTLQFEFKQDATAVDGVIASQAVNGIHKFTLVLNSGNLEFIQGSTLSLSATKLTLATSLDTDIKHQIAIQKSTAMDQFNIQLDGSYFQNVAKNQQIISTNTGMVANIYNCITTGGRIIFRADANDVLSRTEDLIVTNFQIFNKQLNTAELGKLQFTTGAGITADANGSRLNLTQQSLLGGGASNSLVLDVPSSTTQIVTRAGFKDNNSLQYQLTGQNEGFTGMEGLKCLPTQYYNSSSDSCEACNVTNCSMCLSSSTCALCSSGYQLDPFGACISACTNQNTLESLGICTSFELMYFDGATNQFDFSGISVSNLYFSIGAFVYIEDRADTSNTTSQRLVTLYDSNNNLVVEFDAALSRSTLTPSVTLQLDDTGSNTTTLTSSETLSFNTWHYLEVTITGTILYISVDGNEENATVTLPSNSVVSGSDVTHVTHYILGYDITNNTTVNSLILPTNGSIGSDGTNQLLGQVRNFNIYSGKRPNTYLARFNRILDGNTIFLIDSLNESNEVVDLRTGSVQNSGYTNMPPPTDILICSKGWVDPASPSLCQAISVSNCAQSYYDSSTGSQKCAICNDNYIVDSNGACSICSTPLYNSMLYSCSEFIALSLDQVVSALPSEDKLSSAPIDCMSDSTNVDLIAKEVFSIEMQDMEANTNNNNDDCSSGDNCTDHTVGFWFKASDANQSGKVIFQINKKCFMDEDNTMLEAFIFPDTFRYEPQVGDIKVSIPGEANVWYYFSYTVNSLKRDIVMKYWDGTQQIQQHQTFAPDAVVNGVTQRKINKQTNAVQANQAVDIGFDRLPQSYFIPNNNEYRFTGLISNFNFIKWHLEEDMLDNFNRKNALSNSYLKEFNFISILGAVTNNEVFTNMYNSIITDSWKQSEDTTVIVSDSFKMCPDLSVYDADTDSCLSCDSTQLDVNCQICSGIENGVPSCGVCNNNQGMIQQLSGGVCQLRNDSCRYYTNSVLNNLDFARPKSSVCVPCSDINKFVDTVDPVNPKCSLVQPFTLSLVVGDNNFDINPSLLDYNNSQEFNAKTTLASGQSIQSNATKTQNFAFNRIEALNDLLQISNVQSADEIASMMTITTTTDSNGNDVPSVVSTSGQMKSHRYYLDVTVSYTQNNTTVELGSSIVLTTISGVEVITKDGPGAIMDQATLDAAVAAGTIELINGSFTQNSSSIALNTLRNATMLISSKIVQAGSKFNVRLGNFADFQQGLKDGTFEYTNQIQGTGNVINTCPFGSVDYSLVDQDTGLDVVDRQYLLPVTKSTQDVTLKLLIKDSLEIVYEQVTILNQVSTFTTDDLLLDQLITMITDTSTYDKQSDLYIIARSLELLAADMSDTDFNASTKLDEVIENIIARSIAFDSYDFATNGETHQENLVPFVYKILMDLGARKGNVNNTPYLESLNSTFTIDQIVTAIDNMNTIVDSNYSCGYQAALQSVIQYSQNAQGNPIQSYSVTILKEWLNQFTQTSEFTDNSSQFFEFSTYQIDLTADTLALTDFIDIPVNSIVDIVGQKDRIAAIPTGTLISQGLTNQVNLLQVGTFTQTNNSQDSTNSQQNDNKENTLREYYIISPITKELLTVQVTGQIARSLNEEHAGKMLLKRRLNTLLSVPVKVRIPFESSLDAQYTNFKCNTVVLEGSDFVVKQQNECQFDQILNYQISDGSVNRYVQCKCTQLGQGIFYTNTYTFIDPRSLKLLGMPKTVAQIIIGFLIAGLLQVIKFGALLQVDFRQFKEFQDKNFRNNDQNEVMKDLEMRTKDNIPLDFLYTNRTIYKPSKAKERWAKHEVVKMTNAKKLNRKNENILEELTGLKDEEVRVIEEDENGHSAAKDPNEEGKLTEQLNQEEQMNINDEPEADEEDEIEDMIEQPNALNLNKPMDEVDGSPMKPVGSRDTLNFDDTKPLMPTDNDSPQKEMSQSSERLDQSFIGSQVGQNVNKGLEDQINKIDELEMVPEEEEDEEEIDWWDLTLILLKHTHPFCVIFFSNRFNPKHIRLTLVYTELVLLFLASILYFMYQATVNTEDVSTWVFDQHVTNLIGPAILLAMLVNVSLHVLSWVSSMQTMGEKNELIGIDQVNKEVKDRKDLQQTLFFGYLSSISMKIRILIFQICCLAITVQTVWTTYDFMNKIQMYQTFQDIFVLFVETLILNYFILELLQCSTISAIVCASREIEALGWMIQLGSIMFRLKHMKAMTQITFQILSNSLQEEINGEDALRKMDVDNKIEEFKKEHGLNVDFQATAELTTAQVCKGIVAFIEDEDQIEEGEGQDNTDFD